MSSVVKSIKKLEDGMIVSNWVSRITISLATKKNGRQIR